MTAGGDAPGAMARALSTAEPAQKGIAAAEAALLADDPAAWPELDCWPAPPGEPARPPRPQLAAPRDVPRRRLGTPAGRIALLHALAHIEFNAIDLAFDLALRFARAVDAAGLDGRRFAADWCRIGGEEANHFNLLESYLQTSGARYGDLPAHAGLWESAQSTTDDALARLAVAHLILEARGLDVTPDLADRLSRAGDDAAAGILRRIYEDEIGHVACATGWFVTLAQARGLEPVKAFRDLAMARFRGSLRPPFNDPARRRAGLTPDFYGELVRERQADAAATN